MRYRPTRHVEDQVMSRTWIVITTFFATTLLAIAIAQLIYDWLLRYRLELRARLREFSGDDHDDVALFHSFVSGHQLTNSMRRSFSERLANVFHQAGVEATAGRLLMWCIGCGALLAIP